ncbi:MAG: hypothetical protein MUC49_15495 [Raineya sp.]|jgi:hypothetical protein|nr:hypothetical protein [Raineya sp.]
MKPEYNDILPLLEEIRDAIEDGENTATRVGTALVQIINGVFLLGNDKSTDLNPPVLNTHVNKTDSIITLNADNVAAGYTKRGRVYLESTQNAEVSRKVSKNGSESTTEGQLQQSLASILFGETSSKKEFEIKKYLSASIRTNKATIENGYDGQYPYVKISIDQNFEQEGNTVTNKKIDILLRKNTIGFYFDNSLMISFDTTGIKSTNAQTTANLLSSENFIAPYNQVKSNNVNYSPTANSTIDLLGRHENLVSPNPFLTAIGTRTYKFSNTFIGQKINMIIRLAPSSGEVTIENPTDDLTNVFQKTLPSNLTSDTKKLTNTDASIRVFLLSGQFVDTKIIYWKVDEF